MASKRAADREAETTREATEQAAAAALRLSRIERLDPLVEQLQEAAATVAYKIDRDDWSEMGTALVNLIRQAGGVWTRALAISPHFAEYVHALWTTVESELEAVIAEDRADNEDIPPERLDDAARHAWAINDVCLAWLRDAEGFERERTSVAGFVELARLRTRPSPDQKG